MLRRSWVILMTDAIFVHIPKNGGTSVSWQMRTTSCSRDGFHMWEGHFTAPLRKLRLTQMLGYRESCPFWNKCFKFTFIRNPWSRLVSVYHFVHKLIPEQIESFDQWVHEGLPITDHARDRLFHMEDKRTFLDQEAWFCDFEGNEIVDFVGRLEQLQQDWQTVCKRLHFAPNIMKQHANRGAHDPWKDYYTPETKKIVADRFGAFIERYKYQF